MHPLSKKVLKIMRETPISAIAIAQACNISRGGVYRWIKTGNIDKVHFETLARISGTTIEWWIGNLNEEIKTANRLTAKEPSPEYLLNNFDEETLSFARAFSELNPLQRAQAKAVMTALNNATIDSKDQTGSLSSFQKKDDRDYNLSQASFPSIRKTNH
jgi:hypothetical protein